MHLACIEYGLDVFNFIPITFIFNTDSPEFTTDVLHFFRFFKGLEFYNFLNQKRMAMNNHSFNMFYKKPLKHCRSNSEIMTFQNKKTMNELTRLRTRSRSIQKKIRVSLRNESVQPVHSNYVGIHDRSKNNLLNSSENRDDLKEKNEKKKKTFLENFEEDLYCLQNFYFEILENAIRILPKKKKNKNDKSDAPKVKVEASNITKLKNNCFNLKKTIFKKILNDMNYPNQSIENNLDQLNEDIDLYVKMLQSISNRYC
jgi:hypothetical protein